MKSDYKTELLEDGAKEGYEYFNYADKVLRFAEHYTKEDVNPETILNKIDYLEWALAVYNSKGTPLFYIENGIAKDQFADPIREEISFLKDARERFLKSQQRAKKEANRVFRKENRLEFDTIISAAVFYYNKYYSTGKVQNESEAFRLAIDDQVTIKGIPVTLTQLTTNFDTAFTKNTLKLENGKAVWCKVSKKY